MTWQDYCNLPPTSAEEVAEDAQIDDIWSSGKQTHYADYPQQLTAPALTTENVRLVVILRILIGYRHNIRWVASLEDIVLIYNKDVRFVERLRATHTLDMYYSSVANYLRKGHLALAYCLNDGKIRDLPTTVDCARTPENAALLLAVIAPRYISAFDNEMLQWLIPEDPQFGDVAKWPVQRSSFLTGFVQRRFMALFLAVQEGLLRAPKRPRVSLRTITAEDLWKARNTARAGAFFGMMRRLPMELVWHITYIHVLGFPTKTMPELTMQAIDIGDIKWLWMTS